MATVRDTSTENKINIVTTTENNVNVTQPVTSIVTISALGPQGAQGPQGQPGEIPSTGSFVLTSSFNAFTSSYYVDSSSFSTRIINLENFSSSLDATFATDAELNAATASLSASISYLSSSFKVFSGSYNTGSFTGSFKGDGSQLTGIVSSKWTGSNPISRDGNVEITGSLNVTNGITASLYGTASWAENSLTASYITLAQTASYIENAQTASYVLNALSSSFASSGTGEFTGSFTGSYIGDGAGLYNIPASGIVGLNLSQIVSGSVSASISPNAGLQVNTNVTATSFTGSLLGTASFATSASQAVSSSFTITASFAQTAQTASYVLNAVSSSYSSFAISASYAVSASHEIIKEVSSSYADTASFAQSGDGIFSGSFSGSYEGDGSQLTGIFTDPFPFVGDAVITGSLVVSASATSQSLSVQGSGSTVFDVIGSVGTLFSVDDDLTGTLFSVNDISGFPVLQASASGDVFIGKSPQSLYTTAVISSTTAATTHSLCTLSTSSYDGAFFEYTAQSASNARAGNIMSTWNGSNIVYAETTTMDIGDTSDLTTEVIISGSTARLVAYGANAGYKIKTIIKAI
jgi:hypothetical protein